MDIEANPCCCISKVSDLALHSSTEWDATIASWMQATHMRLFLTTLPFPEFQIFLSAQCTNHLDSLSPQTFHRLLKQHSGSSRGHATSWAVLWCLPLASATRQRAAGRPVQWCFLAFCFVLYFYPNLISLLLLYFFWLCVFMFVIYFFIFLPAFYIKWEKEKIYNWVGEDVGSIWEKLGKGKQ